MNTIMNMDPFRILDELFNMKGPAYRNMRARAAGRFPPVNVFLDDNAVLIDLELPGKTAKDIDLTLEPQAVVIADKPTVEEGKETPAPAWSRRLNLPFRMGDDVKPRRDFIVANAKFTNGILRIELPKAEAQGVRKIAIA